MNPRKLTNKQKEAIKYSAITALYTSKIIHDKVRLYNIKHFRSLPEAKIEEDVCNHVFMLLWQYDTDTIVKNHLNDPNGQILKEPNYLIGLSVDLIKWKGYGIDKRKRKFWCNSLGQQIVNQSIFKYDNNYLETTNDFGDTLDVLDDNFNYDNQDPYFEVNEIPEDITIPKHLHINQENKDYWLYIKKNLSKEENKLLDKYLSGVIRLTNICNTENKYEYRQLIKTIKKITKTYLIEKEENE